MGRCDAGGAQMNTHPIPPVAVDRGGWGQPDREQIKVDEKTATMSVSTFNELAEYSCTMPTGVDPGKMWKRHDGAHDEEFIAGGGTPTWYLCWYGLSEKGPEFCSNNYRKIVLTDADISVPGFEKVPEIRQTLLRSAGVILPSS